MQGFDLIVIGAGPGGYVAAINAAERGLRTAVIEREHVGGTCLNRGCVPTKSLLHSAEVYRAAREGDLFGITAGEVSFDMAKINARRDGVVTQMRGGVEQLLKKTKVTVIRGEASIKSAGAVCVKTAEENLELQTKNIIIATGSRPNTLPPRLQNLPGVFTSDEATTASGNFPKRMLILGGGVIGVEFAGFYNSLGCAVTVVDSMSQILGRMDDEISKSLTKLLTKRGVSVLTSAELKDITENDGGLTGFVLHKGGTKEICVDGVLVSVGRSPVTECVLPESGIQVNARGYILVDENLQTNVPGVYAIGDCTAGSVQLAHAASAQGLNAVSHIAGDAPAVNMNAIPACVYTVPEIATVGLTQAEAEAKGIAVKVGKYLTNGNAKSIITGEERGFVKLVFEAETNAIIGAHLMCARATDIVGELTLAVAYRKTAKEIASVIRPHPTYEEAVTEASTLSASWQRR